jgi:hypothetical protein
LEAATSQPYIKQQAVRGRNDIYYDYDSKLMADVKGLSSPERCLKDTAAALPSSPNRTPFVGHRKLPSINTVTQNMMVSPTTDGGNKTTTDAHPTSQKSGRSSPFCGQQVAFTRPSAAQDYRPLKNVNGQTLRADKMILWLPQNAIGEESRIFNGDVDVVDSCRRQKCSTSQKESTHKVAMGQQQRSNSVETNGSIPQKTKQIWSKNQSTSKISSVQRGLPRRRQALDDQWWIRGPQTGSGICPRCSDDGYCDRNEMEKVSHDRVAVPRGIYWKSSANTSLHQDSLLQETPKTSPTSRLPLYGLTRTGSDNATATVRKLPSVGYDRADTWWRHSDAAINPSQCELNQINDRSKETRPANSASQLHFVRSLQQQQSDDVIDDSCRQRTSKEVLSSAPSASVSTARSEKTINGRTTSNDTPVGLACVSII